MLKTPLTQRLLPHKARLLVLLASAVLLNWACGAKPTFEELRPELEARFDKINHCDVWSDCATTSIACVQFYYNKNADAAAIENDYHNRVDVLVACAQACRIGKRACITGKCTGVTVDHEEFNDLEEGQSICLGSP